MRSPEEVRKIAKAYDNIHKDQIQQTKIRFREKQYRLAVDAAIEAELYRRLRNLARWVLSEPKEEPENPDE